MYDWNSKVGHQHCSAILENSLSIQADNFILFSLFQISSSLFSISTDYLALHCTGEVEAIRSKVPHLPTSKPTNLPIYVAINSAFLLLLVMATTSPYVFKCILHTLLSVQGHWSCDYLLSPLTITWCSFPQYKNALIFTLKNKQPLLTPNSPPTPFFQQNSS